jgi:transcriptional regulator with XRE-family HTH domain
LSTPKANYFFFSIYFLANLVYYNNIPELGGDSHMSNLGNKEIFAKNLAFYLERSGKDQREVAEVLGVAPSTFNEWMKAKKYPRIDKIEMLANYFGILKSDLIEAVSENGYSPSEPQLTEGEQLMLELFRRIPEDRQPAALELLRAALKMQ